MIFKKHQDRLKEILEQVRKKDPSLPSWNSLISEDCYIDSYGFKYHKMSDRYRLHYICQQIKMSISKQPNHLEDKAWESKIKDWKKSIFVTVKNLSYSISNSIEINFFI